MDGIQKTALFLSGLEWKTVDLLLGRLDPESAKAVRRAMMSLGTVTPQETNRITGEFLTAAGINRPAMTSVSSGAYSPYRTGTMKTVEFGGETVFVSPGSNNATKTNPRKNLKPFEFLAPLDASDIAAEIAGEHAQTIAIVLAHLPASKAGEVLGVLPDRVQIEVARRLTEFDPISDTEFLPEIEAVLKERFDRYLSKRHRRKQGVAVMEHILKATNPETQARIRSNLRREASQERPDVDTFDELIRRDDHELASLFRSLDLRVTTLSLIGANPALIERVTERMTPEDKQRIRREFRQFRDVDENDVQKARQIVLERAERIFSER